VLKLCKTPFFFSPMITPPTARNGAPLFFFPLFPPPPFISTSADRTGLQRHNEFPASPLLFFPKKGPRAALSSLSLLPPSPPPSFLPEEEKPGRNARVAAR